MNIKRFIRLLLEEVESQSSPSVENVNNAIDNHEKIIISYDGEGKDKFKGPRIIDIYAYGLTRAGNPVVRAFQKYPHHSKTIKGWKFFRLDRITSWKNTGQKFYKPVSFGQYGEFNENGDKTMSVVYNIAKFGDDDTDVSLAISPKTKEQVKQTSSEVGLKRLKNAVENPIFLKDIKKDDGFSGLKDTYKDTGPKKKMSKPYNKMNGKERDEYRAWKQYANQANYNLDDIYKTMDNNNDIDKLSDEFFSDYEKSQNRSQKERDKRALGITGELTPEKLANAQGSVDKMKKYHKGSANDYINQISREELNKALERLKKEQNNS